MTDKEQIIIDGVDVGECKHFYLEAQIPEIPFAGYSNICCEENTAKECKDSPNCYFKQLARKTQECEELKNRKLKLELNENHNKNEIKKLKNRIRKDREFFKNKISSLTLARKEFLEALDHFNWQIGLVKNDRYRKALEEIEEVWEKDKDGDYDFVKRQILDIIADLRTDETKCNPDSEQIEHTAAKPQMRNSVSVEQIQDNKAKGEGND